MKIVIYKKTGCPWAAAAVGFLNALDLSYDLRNISAHPHYAREVEEISGQSKSPTIIIDEMVLPDASVQDLAEALDEKGIEA
jgi:glutaredoxin